MRRFMNLMLLAQKTIRKRRRRERSMEKKKRKTKTTTATPPKSYVPEELITEILLSLPVKSLIRFKCYIYYLYGFGYDQLRDDYLVVSLSSCILADEDISRLEYFSLKDNKWNEIENTYFPYTLDKIDPRVGSLYNDAIHWLALHSGSLMEVIIAFDLSERKLFEIPFPNGIEHKSNHCELWIFGEFLSLWAIDCEHRRIEIWVMKEYKDHSSWIKTIVLSTHIFPPHKFSPICSTKNGDIIGTDGARLLRYTNTGELIESSSYSCIADSAASRGSRSIVYTESLLSLPGDDMQSYEDVSD
ncbi:F-box/kelch-repeat protein At3g06240-like [Vicia villosa]|uniref:F-box/kelch-repeat protein At3g06240-like n=1 Tax=Vicia villosa TaxID=3911 RepID=UPI00273AF7D6|nr:F-box/kelch-repeat protein At3g06240-like [Vicia villosa]